MDVRPHHCSASNSGACSVTGSACCYHPGMRALDSFLISIAIVAALGGGAAAQYQGWLIPPGGRDEKSPITADPRAIERGKALYATHCASCHGQQGKGDGPKSDYASDLTDDLRTELNTDGVLFYKIWNGRIKYGKGPTEDMPAFERTLDKEQVWTLVEYLKVLRRRPVVVIAP